VRLPKAELSQPAVFAILLLAAAVLAVPAALGPVRLNDSFWIDWVWLDQFARELAAGSLYPRWLPLSHGGLGSPVFYYYPPLAFYIGSPFVWLGLPVFGAIVATFALGYFASAAGMYLWLKGQARRPLLGALIYLAAPYHACDFYLRGAVAEFIAAAVIPFAMLGLRRLDSGARGGFALTSVSFAALICSHLPLALLASLFLVGPYAALLVYRSPVRAVAVIAAFATGLLLAAVYLVPALALDPFRDAAKLWQDPTLQPQNWSFWNGGRPAAYLPMLIIGITLAIPLAVLALVQRSRWATFGLVCVVLGVGAIPLFWQLPLLHSVQFPFRIFPLAEFALATALASAAGGPLLIALLSVPALTMSAMLLSAPPPPARVTMAELRSLHPDVPENLPPGERPFSWPSGWALDVAAAHRASQKQDGMTIEPTFYFPSWRVECDGHRMPTIAAPDTELLAHRGTNCRRQIGWTGTEMAAAGMSALGFLLLILLGVTPRLRRRSAIRGRRGMMK
jgi:hypothetical protein